MGEPTNYDSVQELQRKLYQKAKSEPKYRFYALYDKIYRMDVLEEAWKQVRRNKGAEGIDGVTIGDVEREGVENYLKGLQQELKDKTYRPQPARRVYIPKGDGTERPLAIPTIKDRVVEAAIKIIIEPIFEADFEDCSYGFRPKRSPQQAIAEVRKYLNYGYKQVVETDIEDCFGTIPHQELLDMVAERIVDGKVLWLIKLFLRAGVMEGKVVKKDDEGTPQGGVISPLLANIYLNQIDKGWKPVSRAARLIRYADDLIIMTRYKAEGYKIGLERMVNRIKLRLKERKTRTVDMNEGSFDFLGYTFMRVESKYKRKEITLYFPSAKAENSIRKRIREITDYRRPIKVGQVVKELTPVVRGWVNYYRLGNSSKKFGKIKQYTAQKVRKFMNRRKQKSGYGWKEYSDRFLYEGLRLYNDYRISWTKAF